MHLVALKPTLDLIVVAVPARGAGCIFHIITLMLLEYNVAVPARGAGCIHYEKPYRSFQEVAVPARGAGCIVLSLLLLCTSSTDGCRPREGCGLHLVSIEFIAHPTPVAVPARGAGCILTLVRQVRGFPFVAVPARGAGCIFFYSY